MRRDARAEEQLEGAQAQGVRQRALDAGRRPRGHVLERRVERAQALHRAERQVRRERAVARVETGALGLGGQRPVGVRALVERAAHHRVGHVAGGAHRRPRR